MFLCKPNNYLSNVAKLSKIIHNSDTQTQHECSISLNLAILFTLLQKKSTTYLERTKLNRRTNPYFKGVRENRRNRKKNRCKITMQH